MNKRIKPYGSWESFLSLDHLVKEVVKLSFPKSNHQGVFWIETRASEKGRSVIVKEGKDLLPKDFSAKTRVHEYGGDPYLLLDDGLVFSNDFDQRLYLLRNGEPVALTHTEKARYANGVYHPTLKVFYYVRELEGENVIVKIDFLGHEEVVASGHDFYSNPTLSPSGKNLCFIAWDHPNMPWDETILYQHDIKTNGTLENGSIIKEGASIQQPKFSFDGALHYISDQSGYWNLYRAPDLCLCPRKADFGLPQWIFGQSTYTFLENGAIILSFIEEGMAFFAKLENKKLEIIPSPYRNIYDLSSYKNHVYFTSSTHTSPREIVSFSDQFEVLQKSQNIHLKEGSISTAQSIHFTNSQGKIVQGFFYPPVSDQFHGPENERPPFILKVHGGPTAQATDEFNLEVQFFTSRGFAYGAVNFGGSTGFGKAYRNRLKKNLGITDVHDACDFTLHLIKEGLIDQDRTLIKGSSSGGYTVLAALAFRDVFQAGVCLYGISDLEALVEDTHKFEAHYNDSLIGPYPENKKLYHERSPIHFAHQIKAPLLLFQGTNDKVVPQNQAEKMCEALKKNQVKHSLVLFEGEGHGFRKKESIKKVLKQELAFYQDLFGVQS